MTHRPPFCAVCRGNFTPQERYERRCGRHSDEKAHLACAELAVFLAEWLDDGSLTYAQVWRRWLSLRDQHGAPQDLARGLRLAAGISQRSSVFC